MSTRLDLIIDQGATWRRTVRWTSDGSPVNLTGATARMQLRQQFTDPTPAIDLTTGNGVTVTGGLGTISIVITATATAALNPGRYVYDLDVTNGTGDVTRLLYGWATVTPEVTR